MNDFKSGALFSFKFCLLAGLKDNNCCLSLLTFCLADFARKSRRIMFYYSFKCFILKQFHVYDISFSRNADVIIGWLCEFQSQTIFNLTRHICRAAHCAVTSRLTVLIFEPLCKNLNTVGLLDEI